MMRTWSFTGDFFSLLCVGVGGCVGTYSPVTQMVSMDKSSIYSEEHRNVFKYKAYKMSGFFLGPLIEDITNHCCLHS